MQIVIDISEDDYRKVQDGRASVSMMRKAIKNGTLLNSLEEMCDLMCDKKLPDNTKMTIKQAKLQLNDLLEYCAESGEKWEDDKKALQIAIRSLKAQQAVRGFVEALKKFENSDDYIRAIDNVLEIIDNALGEVEQ